MTPLTTIEEVITAAKPGMYIVANCLCDGTMDVLLWETEADSENDDGANAIGRWIVAGNPLDICDGVVDADTFG